MPETRRQEQLSLHTIGGGEVDTRFQFALNQALSNIADPDTDPFAKRTITIQVTLKPSEGRDVATVEVTVSTKLPPHEPLSSTILMGMTLGENNQPIPTATEHRGY